MYSVLLDTNILLDYHLGRGEHAAQCADLIARLLEQDAAIMVAASSLKDEFYLIGKALKRECRSKDESLSPERAKAINEIAWACIQQTMEFAHVLDVGFGDCLRAITLRKLHDDLEDNIIAAAGERAKIDYLVTNDKRLLRHASVRCLSAKEMLGLLDAERTAQPE